jgi:hypothetical protein
VGLGGEAGLLGCRLLGGLPLLEGPGGELTVLFGLRRGRVGQRLGAGLGVGRGLVRLLG